MSHLNFQNQRNNYSSSKPNKYPNKKRLTQEQVRRLEISFDSNNRLEPDRKLLLARDLNIPPRQVAIWYQNKRARCKTRSLELDYEALQLRLEAALADKLRLEGEVERLQGELNESREIILANLKLPPHYDHRMYACGNISSSSTEDHVSLNISSCFSVVDNEDLEIDLDLYDDYCNLMGPRVLN